MVKCGYDYTSEELVNAYASAIQRTTGWRRGLTVSLASTAGWDDDEIYFRGILLSRLEGEKRPFSRGDSVTLADARHLRAIPPGHLTETEHTAMSSKSFTVERAYYLGARRWAISLKEVTGQRLFSTDAFTFRCRAAA